MILKSNAYVGPSPSFIQYSGELSSFGHGISNCLNQSFFSGETKLGCNERGGLDVDNAR